MEDRLKKCCYSLANLTGVDEYLINKYDLGGGYFVKDIDFIEIDLKRAIIHFKNGNNQPIKCDGELHKTIKHLFRFIPCCPLCYDVSENVNSLQIVFKIGPEIFSVNVEKSTSSLSSSLPIKGIDVDGDDWILKLSHNPIIDKTLESETNITEKRKRGRPKKLSQVSKTTRKQEKSDHHIVFCQDCNSLLPKRFSVCDLQNVKCNQDMNHNKFQIMCPFCSSFEIVSNISNHIKICPIRTIFNKNKKPDSTIIFIPMCINVLDFMNYIELLIPLCDNIKNSIRLIDCFKMEKFDLETFKIKMKSTNLDSLLNPVYIFASFDDGLFPISQICCEFVKGRKNCSVTQFFSQTLKHPKNMWGDLLFQLLVKEQNGADINIQM